MASTPDFMQFVEEQLRGAGAISHYKMMGDYVVYCDLKVVGVVCGNQFYIKRLPVSEPFSQMQPPSPQPAARTPTFWSKIWRIPHFWHSLFALSATLSLLRSPKNGRRKLHEIAMSHVGRFGFSGLPRFL